MWIAFVPELVFHVSGQFYKQGEKIDSFVFGADPGLPLESGIPDGEVSEAVQPTKAFRCRKCRRIIALEENVINHEPGEGETCFNWHKRKSSHTYDRSDETECSSIFVEPLKWMTTGEKYVNLLHYSSQIWFLFSVLNSFYFLVLSNTLHVY